MPADELSVGDRLLLADDQTATVNDLIQERSPRGEPFTTYNFAVDDCHTYFVGQAGIWVHNEGFLCTRLGSVYSDVLKTTGDHKKAVDEVVAELAKVLKNPKADVEAVKAELAKSTIPGVSPEELFKKAQAKAEKGPAKNYAATLGKATSKDYKTTFFNAHPELKGKVVVHHAIEQQVLTKYPGVLTEAEIHSLENFRGAERCEF